MIKESPAPLPVDKTIAAMKAAESKDYSPQEIKNMVKLHGEAGAAARVLHYEKNQIATNPNEINDQTKVYVGKLDDGFFDKLPKNIEHIYTSFPEGKIVQKKITIGGKTAEELTKEIKEKGDKIYGFTEKEPLVGYKDFKPLKKAEELDLVILSVKDLGFPKGAITQQIYERAQELGLKLVPAEVGPQLRLQYEDQPKGEYLLIGSKPLVTNSASYAVFSVEHLVGGRRNVSTGSGWPREYWKSDYLWVFARPSSSKATTDNGK